MSSLNNASDSDSTQADAEAADGGDKPPHVIADPSSVKQAISTCNSDIRQFACSPTSDKTFVSGAPTTAKYLHAGGHLGGISDRDGSGSITPPSISSFNMTASESDPSTAPQTRDVSRAPSASEDPIKSTTHIKSPQKTSIITSKSPQPSTAQHSPVREAKPPASNTSQTDTPGGQKFNLRDLLGSQSGLVRRPSNRSASSRRSDSERGASSKADTNASLSKKYGVCEKLAIGKGATSVVRLIHKWDRSEEKLYAVKEFRKRRKNETEKEYVKKLTAEFCISSTLHNANIVETVDLVQDEQQRWCEVMEYCPGGDLYAAIKKGGMSTSEIECCFKQILSGVDYLHGQGVAHRDIKPENLFFDAKGFLKIGDYGASTVYRLPWESTVHLSTGLCGSEPYIAPEQFAGKPYDARLVDIWACGVVYYCMQFQELPWRVAQTSDPLYAAYAQTAASQKTDNSAASCPATLASIQPRSARQVIRKLLEPEPKKRWNVKDILAQSWVQGIEVCPCVEKPSHVHAHVRATLKAHAEKMQDPNRRE